MYRYHYFVKRSPILYRYMTKFHCIRLPEGDKRIPEFTKLYASRGWNVRIEHPYEPSIQLEEYKLRLYFQRYDDIFEIVDPDDEPKKEMS